MTALTMRKYHLDGTRFATARNIHGIFSNGNINPVNMIVGSIMPIMEINKAVCCALVELEMSNPSERQVKINNAVSTYKSNRLPLTSMCNRKMDNSRIIVKFTRDNMKYGTALAINTMTGLKGETNRISIVPNSFSLTMETEVRAVQTSIRISAITPGI